MDIHRAQEVIKLAAKKLQQILSFRPMDLLFPKQVDFRNDKSRFKLAICTRRAGKTTGCAGYAIDEAVLHPESNILYIALTRKSSKNIMWAKIDKMLKQKKIPYTPTISDLTFTLWNGSKIILTGANATVEEMEKLLGMSYRLIIIDEGASFRIDLKRLIYEVLRPATADVLGTIAMIGTASDIMTGLFYDVSMGLVKGWSVSRWSAMDNPHMRKNWEIEIAELIAADPDIVHTAGFKRQYLGEWAIDEDNLVYKWSSMRNGHDGWDYLPQDFIYVLGVDLGSNDDSAFVLDAYSPYDETTYEILAYKEKGMDLTDVANTIKSFQKDYNIMYVICDGANKQGVEEMRNRHGLAIKAADKQDKNTFIELMNADMRKGKLKTVVDDCDALISERSMLLRRWDDHHKKWIEDPKFPNHCGDAALYAWRFCYSWLAQKKPTTITESMPEYEDQLMEELEQEYLDDENKPYWEKTHG